ncbi:MAG TPA: xanthine dehydrogenase family protein molybdopterin-binding subunit [Kofleriaceae bacterium]|nr:xanthine dehydrogenase family protein molybdopterin-binding subunit [Kofleriaceae bacterium]
MPHVIGQPTSRIDARRKVTGRADYAAEALLPGMAHGVLVGATIASGRVEAIDTTAAERAPGVVLVLTHRNRGRLGAMPSGLDWTTGQALDPRPPLADDHVRYHGQYVALVVADTLEQAQHAARLVAVRYQEQPPLVALDDPRAPRVAPEAALGVPLRIERSAPVAPLDIDVDVACGDHGDCRGALAAAPVTVDHTYTSPAEHATAMEPHAAIASWTDGELVVHSSTQYVGGERAALAAAMEVPVERVRVVAPFVGGMFGSKIATGGHAVLAALAARQLGRPVKVVLTRPQVFATVTHRPASAQRITLGAGPDGRLQAIRHHTVTQSLVEDGYPDDNEYVEPTTFTSRMLYACPNYESAHELVRLNQMKPGWVRAPGEALCTWALESAMDELACRLGIDPVELRRRNHAAVRPGDGKPFSSKHLLACYDRGAERFGWAQRDPRPGSMRDGDVRIGWGMATATYPGLRLGATVRLRVERLDGSVTATVSTAGADVGQGLYTVVAMTAADALGLPVELISVELGDTRLPPCAQAGGSNLTASVASAIVDAAGELRRRLGVAPDAPFADAVLASGEAAVEAEATSTVIVGETDRLAFQSFGAVFVEVRVDPDLGRIRVARVVGVYDVGRVLNPLAARNQLAGGVVWGLGQALLEGLAYDPVHGQPINGDLAGYLVPVHADIPAIDVGWIDAPDLDFNPLGVRGMGEIGITGVAAAVASAVHHATGVRVRDLPISPERLLG